MRRGKWLVPAVLAAVLSAGCGQDQEVDRSVELQEEVVSESTYELTPVTRGTVQQPLVIDCNYSQTVEIDLRFGVDQLLITDVYVKRGDIVEKGQLLASVDVENIEKQIRELEHEFARANLKLQQLTESLNFDLEQADILYSYTPMSDDDRKALKEQKENIEKSYRSTLEDTADSVEMTGIRLENARLYLQNGNLYAPMDGVVNYLKNDMEGSTTDKEEKVASLYDADSCMFVSDDVEAAPWLDPQEEYIIVCGLGKSQREYLVAPVYQDTWGENIYFQLLDEEYDPNVIKSGKITIITDEAEHVLCVDKEAVHTSGERYYVYLLDEEGIRRMQFVETGLWGTDMVEIQEGLEEGQYVIK
ncbi:MAG: efflux RND transporter periplasmic adaptor subunit [Acetatifactor sp.]